MFQSNIFIFLFRLAVPLRREKLSLALEQEGFLKKVLESFRLAEQNNDTNALQQLYHIFRNIFLLNKNAIFEILFAGKVTYTKI